MKMWVLLLLPLTMSIGSARAQEESAPPPVDQQPGSSGPSDPVHVPEEQPAPPADAAEKWESHICRFEALDQQHPPPAGGVLFVGSSSIRGWDLERWFPEQRFINRGFGGSQISDVNYYAERMVLPYRPKMIVFYAGDNDVKHGKTARRVAVDFRAFAALVMTELPQSHVIYLPIKPSLSRWPLWPVMREANTLIHEYVDAHDRLHYADTASPMLGDEGKPRQELLSADGLHLSEEGYRLWSDIVKEALQRAETTKAAAGK